MMRVEEIAGPEGTRFAVRYGRQTLGVYPLRAEAEKHIAQHRAVA